MSKGNLVFARSESSCGDHREIINRRRCQSQLSTGEHLRSSSQHSHLPTLTAYCAHCKLPLLIDVTKNEPKSRSRASATRQTQRLCQECSNDPGKPERTPSSRLFKSSSGDWTNVGDKIETWFEKAKTPGNQLIPFTLNSKRLEYRDRFSNEQDIENLILLIKAKRNTIEY